MGTYRNYVCCHMQASYMLTVLQLEEWGKAAAVLDSAVLPPNTIAAAAQPGSDKAKARIEKRQSQLGRHLQRAGMGVTQAISGE